MQLFANNFCQVWFVLECEYWKETDRILVTDFEDDINLDQTCYTDLPTWQCCSWRCHSTWGCSGASGHLFFSPNHGSSLLFIQIFHLGLACHGTALSSLVVTRQLFKPGRLQSVIRGPTANHETAQEHPSLKVHHNRCVPKQWFIAAKTIYTVIDGQKISLYIQEGDMNANRESAWCFQCVPMLTVQHAGMWPAWRRTLNALLVLPIIGYSKGGLGRILHLSRCTPYIYWIITLDIQS